MNQKTLAICILVLIVGSAVAGSVFLLNRLRSGPSAAVASSRSLENRLNVVPPIDRSENRPFAFTDQDGNPFLSESLDGKVWVGNFFFSTCPATCFRLMSEMSKLEQEFANEDIHFVSVTVDPKTDTPEVLKAYAQRFNANHKRWSFLTGDVAETAEIGQKVFKLPTAEQTHSDKAIVFDRQGRFTAGYNLLKPEERELFKLALRQVLKETS